MHISGARVVVLRFGGVRGSHMTPHTEFRGFQFEMNEAAPAFQRLKRHFLIDRKGHTKEHDVRRAW
jgi:hypothetical protein